MLSYAIVVAKYNEIGLNKMEEYGILGSAFFIDLYTALTSYHVINPTELRGADGFKYRQFWIASRNGRTVPLRIAQYSYAPEVDATMIKFKNSVSPLVSPVSLELPTVGTAVYNTGYDGRKYPPAHANWVDGKIVIDNIDLSIAFADNKGRIGAIYPNQVVRTENVVMEGKTLFYLPYAGCQGMSGGALMDVAKNKAIGLMSLGLPPDVPYKKVLFAIWIKDVLEQFEWSPPPAGQTVEPE